MNKIVTNISTCSTMKYGGGSYQLVTNFNSSLSTLFSYLYSAFSSQKQLKICPESPSYSPANPIFRAFYSTFRAKNSISYPSNPTFWAENSIVWAKNPTFWANNSIIRAGNIKLRAKNCINRASNLNEKLKVMFRLRSTTNHSVTERSRSEIVIRKFKNNLN